MSVEQMRDYIKEVYKNSPGFCYRVDRMHGNQIIAIYHNLINRKPNTNKKAKAAGRPEKDTFLQDAQLKLIF